MFKRILCPTDFSENSYKAMLWAEYFAQKFDSKLVIAHVLPFPENSLFADMNFQANRASAITSLNKLVAHLRVEHETILNVGDASQKILQEARNLKATGIVMGTRGISGMLHKVFGSTTENVMRESDLPILTISPDCCKPGVPKKRNILIPVSRLDPSFRGHVKLRHIVRQMDSSVQLLHVVDYDDSMFQSHFYSSPFRVVDLETEDRKQRLIRIGGTLSSDLTNIRVDPIIRFGNPAMEILNEISSHRYDIVLMKIKKGTLGSRFFDSVAYKVISQGVVPVITIRANS